MRGSERQASVRPADSRQEPKCINTTNRDSPKSPKMTEGTPASERIESRSKSASLPPLEYSAK